MRRLRALRGLVLALAALCVGFRPVPKESAKALGVTRGKSFSSGLVFVNGKCILPPYVVERWGTGLRVNGVPVSGQVIDWDDFLKTQSGVKSVVVTSAPPEQAVQPAVEPAKVPVDESPAAVAAASADSLDDLFDDNPKSAPETKPAPEKPAVPAPLAETAKPKVHTVCELSGDFEPNDESKALVQRINASRTEIDRLLRSGGFACFGDGYSMVAGDKRSLMKLLETLPGLQESAADLAEFRAGVQRAGLVFLNEVLCADLYRNRADSRKLKTRYKRLNLNQKWDKVVERTADPLF